MDGNERSGKVNKADDRWLLLTMSGFKDPSQCEYPTHTSTPNVKSGLVGLRPRITHGLEPPEKNKCEDVRSDFAAAVVLETSFISLLVGKHKDTRTPVLRNGLVCPRLSNHLIEPKHQSVDTRPVDFSGYTVLSRCLNVVQPLMASAIPPSGGGAHDTG
ncbi:unnamed protein product [Dibothriocephalus latus]|uniref:Uncharacterized protein n=1 Tax=Dibothriocephalus latus TaxID=60516 RepID=A0A3P7LUF4_DIBLA|nr:unnamed protein product [Dibothriocephalus latus]